MAIKREDLARVDFSDVADGSVIVPIHPGEHLADYLEGAGVSQYRVSMAVHVPPRRINEIVKGKRTITADTAVRLGRFFGTNPIFWMNLQAAYDLEKAKAAITDLNEMETIAAAG